MQRQGMARVWLDIELNGTGVGERTVQGLKARHILAVTRTDEEIQLWQDIMDRALERAGRHDEEPASRELGDSGRGLQGVAMVEQVGREIAAEES